MGGAREDFEDAGNDRGVEAVDGSAVGAVGALAILGANWWAIALRGALAIALGALVAAWPGLSAQLLAVVFANYLLVDATLGVVTAIAGAENRRQWWPMLAESVVGVAVAAWIYLSLDTGVAELALVVGGWAVLTGAFELYSAVLLRRLLDAREWWLTLAGVVSVAVGAALLALPDPSLSTLARLLVGYALLSGGPLLALAVRVRNVEGASHAAAPT